MKIISQSAELLSPLTREEKINTVRMIELAGRNCYSSTDKMTEDSYEIFVPNLIKRGHESPLEFCEIILRLKTSRDVMAEWTRHRLISVAISSQRYVLQDGKDGIEFIMPQMCTSGIDDAEAMHNLAGACSVWEDSCRACEHYYRELLRYGAKKEDARKVLNNSVATTIITKMNARELRHILKVRLTKFAYPEMQHLAKLILKQVRDIPVLFDDIFNGN